MFLLRRRMPLFAVLCLAVAVSAPIYSQDQTTGAITGRAVDVSGALIPSVDVTITSSAMIGGARTAVTNEQGVYRFTLLPAGTYRVSFVLPGFRTLNLDGVDVVGGQTRTINGTMEVASVAEEITVTSQAPTIDLEAATVGVNWDIQKLNNLPYARSLKGLTTMIPGLYQTSYDVGGSSFANTSGVSARTYGRNGNNVVAIDGNVWDQVYPDYGAFEEVSISTASKDAAQMNAGVTLNMVLKSGSNNFHGGFSTDLEKGSFQSKNVDDKLLKAGYSPGSNKFTILREIYGEIAGPVLRDKLWFYFTERDSKQGNFIPGFISMQTGKPAEFPNKLQGPTAKLTYQLTENQKIDLSWQLGRKSVPFRTASRYLPLEATSYQRSWATSGPNLKWTYIVGPRMTATAALNRGGYWWQDYVYSENGRKSLFSNLPTGEVRRQDLRISSSCGFTDCGAVLGPAQDIYRRPIRWSWNGDVSLFNDIGGKNNEFKFGYAGWWDKMYISTPGYPNQQIYRYRSLDSEDFNATTPDNLRRLYQRPHSVQIFDGPTKVSSVVDYTAFYITDKITWSRKLTTNIGFRLDRFSTSLPEQGNTGEGPFGTRLIYPGRRDFPIYTKLVPRLSFAYDVLGDGKLALKASYGRYIDSGSGIGAKPGPGAFDVNPNAAKNCIFNNWDGSIPYVPVTANLAGCSNGNWNAATGRIVATQFNRRLGDGLKANYLDEYTGSIEVGFTRDYSLRFNVIRKFDFPGTRTYDLAQPFDAYTDVRTQPDPGPDGVLGTADDTGRNLRPIYVWSVPRNYPTFGQTDQLIANVRPGEGKSQYTAYEGTFNRQFSSGWSALAGYAVDMARENSNWPDNPNALWYQFSKPYWRQAIKMNGTYQFPWGLMWAGTFSAQSGAWYDRTVQVRNALNSTVNVTVENRVGRYGWVNLWDNRLSKTFRIGDRQSIEAMFDLFNTLNINTITSWTIQSGSTYHRPNEIISPRIFKLSARYRF